MALAGTHDQVGRVLQGRYRILELVGTGSSAHVFVAQDVELHRLVAVKILHPVLATDQAFLKRFRVEARAAAALSHPYLVRVYDWGEEDGQPFLVLELAAGGSLRDMLDTGVLLSPAQAAMVGTQAARGLAYAHSRGLVHRDIKPANILFDEDGQVRLGDFGLAKALAQAAWTEPAGAVIGTARYASPEQAQGSELDGRSDVYSLSLVLYEAVTGELPFPGDTAVATLVKRLGAPLPPDDRLGPLYGVLEAAAAPKAEDRLEAGSMAAALDELLDRFGPPDVLPFAPPSVRRALLASGGSDRDPTAIAGNMGPSGVGPTGRKSPAPGATLLGGVLPGGDSQATGQLATSVMEPVGGGQVGWEAGLAPGGLRGGDGRPSLPVGKRKRHRGLKILLAVVILLVLAAGAGAGLYKAGFFVKKKPLVSLVGMPVSRASSLLAKNKDKAVVLRRRADPSVPAGDVIRQIPAAGTKLPPHSIVRLVVSTGPPIVSIPNLSGDTEASAVAALTSAHLRSTVQQEYDGAVPAGQVVSWSPTGKAKWGSNVVVVISEGPRPRIVPNLLGESESQAEAKLSSMGLGAKVIQRYSNSVPSGEVIATEPGSGGSVPKGTVITLVVSLGPQMVTVPNLNGDSVGQAARALSRVGLVAGSVYGPAGGTVFATIPGAGQSVPVGDVVDLYTM